MQTSKPTSNFPTDSSKNLQKIRRRLCSNNNSCWIDLLGHPGIFSTSLLILNEFGNVYCSHIGDFISLTFCGGLSYNFFTTSMALLKTINQQRKLKLKEMHFKKFETINLFCDVLHLSTSCAVSIATMTTNDG